MRRDYISPLCVKQPTRALEPFNSSGSAAHAGLVLFPGFPSAVCGCGWQACPWLAQLGSLFGWRGREGPPTRIVEYPRLPSDVWLATGQPCVLPACCFRDDDIARHAEHLTRTPALPSQDENRNNLSLPCPTSRHQSLLGIITEMWLFPASTG